jgi:multimeric flavodoxin WrbA
MDAPLLISVVSSRTGHVHELAEAACQAYRESGGRAETVSADGCDMRGFDDADAVVFATPTHLGGPAAEFVAFAERTAELRTADVLHSRWAAGITCGMVPDGGKSITLSYLTVDLDWAWRQHCVATRCEPRRWPPRPRSAAGRSPLAPVPARAWQVRRP